MKKLEIILLSLSCLFLGMVLGFFIAPVKKGIEIGNNAGNTTNNFYGTKEDE